jgi:hypothetical protein
MSITVENDADDITLSDVVAADYHFEEKSMSLPTTPRTKFVCKVPQRLRSLFRMVDPLSTSLLKRKTELWRHSYKFVMYEKCSLSSGRYFKQSRMETRMSVVLALIHEQMSDQVDEMFSIVSISNQNRQHLYPFTVDHVVQFARKTLTPQPAKPKTYLLAIEMDGKQHFEGSACLEKNQRRDKNKNYLCRHSDIHLLRIDYTIPPERYESLVKDAMTTILCEPGKMYFRHVGDRYNCCRYGKKCYS